MAKSNRGLARTLSILGGIVMLVEAILSLTGNSFGVIGGSGFIGALSGIVSAILLIVIGVLTLISTGTIKSKKTKVGFNGAILLLFGILAIILGGLLGGVLVIIGAILLLI